MKNVYKYVTAVTKRFPKMQEMNNSSYRLLAHDIKYDIEYKLNYNYNLYSTDARFFEYVESRLQIEEQSEALREFKRHYRTWLRLHSAER